MKKIQKPTLMSVLLIIYALSFTSCSKKQNDNINWSKLEDVYPGYGNIDSYKQIELNITSEKSGLEIGAYLNVPDDFDFKKTYPLMIMCHGYGGTVTDFDQKYISYMIEKNILCLTFFFCGGGLKDSDGGKYLKTTSEGNSEDFSIVTEKYDLISVYNYISNKSFINKDKITLMGESLGGAVVGITTPELNVAGEILLYPGLNVYEGCIATYGSYENIPEKVDLWGLTITKAHFIDDIKDLDLYELTSNTNTPICLIHGTADNIVPISVSNKLLSMAPSCTFYQIDGAGHGFNANDLKEVIPDITSYLLELKVIENDAIEVSDHIGNFVTNHPELNV